MDKRKVGYWLATGFVGLGFVTGGIFDALRTEEALAALTHLGYPGHFAVVLGLWKVVGAIVVLAPKLPRAKEWAYAGMVIDVTGAAVAHAAAGDPVGNIVTPLVMLLFVAASWALRPEDRKLSGPPL